MYHWYFTFFVNVPSSGAQLDDSAVIASTGAFFPIENVYTYFREEFGADAKIAILNTMEITKESYDKMSVTMGIVDENY